MTQPETTDDVLGGRLSFKQHRKGYRFGLDAVLLATDLPELPDSPTIADFGAGQGAVTCVIAHNRPAAHLISVERQPGLFGLLRQNIDANGFTPRIETLCVDLRDKAALPPHEADLVVMNPPYYAANSGLMSSNTERAEAHYELHGGLSDFVAAAQYVAKPGGLFKLVLPPERLTELMGEIDASDFAMRSLRFFHSHLDEPAYLVECVAKRGGRFELEVRPPLVVYADNGEYGAEVKARLELD